MKKVELKPCPFCGEMAELIEAAWTGIEYVRCANKKCPVRPSTYRDLKCYNGKNFEQAKKMNIKAWNRRTSASNKSAGGE